MKVIIFTVEDKCSHVGNNDAMCIFFVLHTNLQYPTHAKAADGNMMLSLCMHCMHMNLQEFVYFARIF